MIARFNFGMLFSRTLGDDEALRIAEISHYISEHYADRLPLWIPLPSHLKFRTCWAELRGYFLDEIRRRRLQGMHKQDVLSVLIALRDTQTGAPWSEREPAACFARLGAAALHHDGCARSRAAISPVMGAAAAI